MTPAVNIPTAASAAYASSAATETGNHFSGRINESNQTGDHPKEENKKYELNDEELDQVVGGVSIGDTVLCSHDDIAYFIACTE